MKREKKDPEDENRYGTKEESQTELSVDFAHQQFNQLIKRNLNLPVRLFHL